VSAEHSPEGGDYTLPGETRLHAQWRRHRERGIVPMPETFPEYLRSIFEGAGEPGLTWERFLHEMYEYASAKGFAGTWDDFLREAGERG
jgi:hypothetical protein